MKTCSIGGCSRRHKARGYCATHYAQHFRGAPITARIKARTSEPFECCIEDDCDQPVKAKGLCKMHYQRHLRHGHSKYTDRKRPPKQCAIPGCDNHLYAKGVCHSHYMKSKKWQEFGLSLDNYLQMAERQNFVCKICEKPEKIINGKSGKTRDLAVDHCHATGRIRGLLCSNCNTSIGLMCDDPYLLQKAIDYLKTPPS